MREWVQRSGMPIGNIERFVDIVQTISVTSMVVLWPLWTVVVIFVRLSGKHERSKP
jgi:hypothetical protein